MSTTGQSESICKPLSFFDPPAEDETLYSACARFHRTSGHQHSGATSMALLGYATGGTRPDFQVGLDHLSQVSGAMVQSDESTVRERTVMRAYMPFMSAEARWRAMTILRGPFANGLKRSQSGLTWSSMSTVHELRLCPSCLSSQRAWHGFGYWETTKQLPGVWVCVEHDELLRIAPRRGSKVSAWCSVNDASTDPLVQTPEVERTVRPFLTRIAQCAQWLASQTTIHREALVGMVRWRLHEDGHCHKETRSTDAELEALQRRFFDPLIRAEIPHYRTLDNADWMRQTLLSRFAGHPSKWAALLAVREDVSQMSLSQDLREATERLPNLQLFDGSPSHRLIRAPRTVYAALTGPVTIDAAASASGIPHKQFLDWLRRDAALSSHWKQSSAHVKHRAALLTIEGAVRANPTMGRANIINRCLWAVRFLETNDPAALQDALPPVHKMFDRQSRLPLE